MSYDYGEMLSKGELGIVLIVRYIATVHPPISNTSATARDFVALLLYKRC